MTTTFQPAPTYADVVLIDPITKAPKFNPLWLKWFLDVASFISSSGGGGGTAADHAALANLQGGISGERYHLTVAELSAVDAAVAGTKVVTPTTDAGAAQTVCHIFAGNGAPSNANGINGDFYFRANGGVGTNLYKKTAGAWAAIL